MGKCDAAERRPFSTSCESALINDVLLMAWARKQRGGRVDFQICATGDVERTNVMRVQQFMIQQH